MWVVWGGHGENHIEIEWSKSRGTVRIFIGNHSFIKADYSSSPKIFREDSIQVLCVDEGISGGRFTYIPQNESNPATKKYVDDAITKATDADLDALFTTD